MLRKKKFSRRAWHVTPGQEVKIERREKLARRGRHNTLINAVDPGDSASNRKVSSRATLAAEVKPFNYG